MSSNIRITRICEQCEKHFVAKTTVTKCCSDACAKRLYKMKVKGKKIDQSNAVTQIMGVMPLETWKNREYFSLEEFSKLVGVSRWTLWRAIKRCDIVAGKIGRRVIIQRTELDKFFITKSK